MHKTLTAMSELVRQETFPSLNLTPYERFKRACRRHKIEVVNSTGGVEGMIFSVAKRPPTIVLRSDLHETHRDFVAFHELGHYLLDSSDEFSVNFFAFLALSQCSPANGLLEVA